MRCPMRHFKKNLYVHLIISLLLLFFSSAFASDSNSRSDGILEESILEVIRMRNSKESPEWWRSLGPAAPKAILSLYRKTNSTYIKIRLLEALRWFDDSTATDLMKNEFEQNRNELIRAAAIRAIGMSQGMKEAQLIERALKNSSGRLRVAAAQGLLGTTDSEAHQMVDRFLLGEKQEWVVRKVLQRRNVLKGTEDENSESFDSHSPQKKRIKIEKIKD